MFLAQEIKTFLRQALLLGLVLSVFVNLLVLATSGASATATTRAGLPNELKFSLASDPYIGAAWVALSVNIGTQAALKGTVPVALTSSTLAASAALAQKEVARGNIIASEMMELEAYLNLLKTDVNVLMNSSSDRAGMLEDFLDTLSSRLDRSRVHVATLKAQIADLQATASRAESDASTQKTALESAYKSLDASVVETSIGKLLEARRQGQFAATYLVFLQRFVDAYTVLDAYNARLAGTVSTNREALVKSVTVILPSTGTDLMRKLKLVANQTSSN